MILAIRDCGADHLFHEKVGVEPTGDPFNSIVKLETRTRPFNPFINAGHVHRQAGGLHHRLRGPGRGGGHGLRVSASAEHRLPHTYLGLAHQLHDAKRRQETLECRQRKRPRRFRRWFSASVGGCLRIPHEEKP